MKCWCKCEGRKPCVYDWFKCFRDGKETTEDEPRSGRPSTSRTRECDRWWHKIGEWLYTWWRRNWALARTRCTPSSVKIWVSRRSVHGMWRTSWQERVTAVLRSIPKEAFAGSFQKLFERCQKCVLKDGDYFEDQIKLVCLNLVFFLLFSDTIHRTF